MCDLTTEQPTNRFLQLLSNIVFVFLDSFVRAVSTDELQVSQAQFLRGHLLYLQVSTFLNHMVNLLSMRLPFKFN